MKEALMMVAADALPRQGATSKEGVAIGVPRSTATAEDRNTILVVDDDDGVREALETVLTDAGYHVELAANGREALHAFDAGLRPGLIVLDLRMPIMTGWGVWDHMQLTPTLRDVPVVVFTGTGLSQGSVGPATVVSKAVTVERLLTIVARLLAQ